MSLAKKLNLKDGMAIRVVSRPVGVDLDDVESTALRSCPNVLVFVRTAKDVDARVATLTASAAAGGLTWVAYPKAGLLETDLNRDILRRHLEPIGVKPVRQVAIDAVWSAMRTRRS